MDLPPGLTSLFPLASLFHPPDNLPSLPPLTPLSPPSTLLSSPSLLPHSPASPPSATHFYSLHSLLRPELPCPHFSPYSLRPSPAPLVSNLLAALPSRLPCTLHLFFPTSENAHAIGFVSVKYTSPGSSGSPDQWQVTLDDDTGDVFKQMQGFRQACNRICYLAVSPCSGGGIRSDNRRVSEGFLLATTLYTVNWFRVETGPVELDCEERQRPFLAPLANYGFNNPVVHACFSPHINEECAVLLQNGELYLFNLCSKQSGKIRVVLKNGHSPGRFISCEYGAEPWTVIVACAKAIVSVDVRYQGEGQTRVLFQPKKLGCYDVNRLEDKKEKFLVFCKSGYSNYHFSVLTKSRLMLLDVRWPCHPVLTWDHGLDNPNYVTMLKLEERKPSDGHEAVSGSGYSILAGSLSSGEFKLFHYGPTHELGAPGDSSLFALGVPSGIFLSGDCSGTSKELMDKIVSGKSTLVKDITWLKKREKIVGFFMIPPEFSRIRSDSIGFTLIRLMSFGRLEVQNYGRSDDIPDNKMWMKEESTSASCDILTVCPDCKREEVPKRRYFLDLRYLNAYVHGDLSEILPMDNRQSCDDTLSEDLLALMRDSMNYTPSLSPFIENATLPASIAEIAYKSALNGLKPDLIPLAFAKYSDVFQQVSKGGNFQLLEVSRNSNFGEQRPLIITKPYRRGLKWTKKSKAPRDKLLGPVLPVPVLLTLEEREKNGKCFGFDGDGTIMYQKCMEVHDCIFPANLSADTEESKIKPFFVHEPQYDIVRSKKLKRADNRDCRDGNYETFVCGINSRPSQDQVKPEPDVAGAELFDVGPVRMDFGCSNIEVGKFESDELGKLKGQFSDWLNKFKPYQDFISSSKIPTFNQ